MPPRVVLRLPRRLLTTAARLGRPEISIKFRKRVAQTGEATSADDAATDAPSTLAPLGGTTVSTPVNVTTVINGTLLVPSLRRKRREGVKETLLLVLQGLVASTDAFPPLKSAVGGLTFLVDQVELVSSNKAQALDIYARIHTIVASLMRAIPTGSAPFPAHEAALRALGSDLEALCASLQDTTRERKRFLKRHLYAKSHRAQLQDIVRHLDDADSAFMRTMISSAEANGAKALIYLQDMRRAEAVGNGGAESRGSFFFELP